MHLHGVDTMWTIWKWVVYDMMCCLFGVFMPHDAFGIPWAGPHTSRPRSGRIMGEYFLGFLQIGFCSSARFWHFINISRYLVKNKMKKLHNSVPGADNDYYANYLKLKNMSNVESPCEYCPCHALAPGTLMNA